MKNKFPEKMMKPFSILRFSSLILLLLAAGCGTTSWKKPDVSALLPPGPPKQVVAVWEPAVKHSANNEQPERGFAGRVFFYDQSMKRPVKVKGNVVIYAFDEEGRKPNDNQPDRSYVFEAQDVKKLYSKSKLGPAYSFWVPWDSDGPDGNVKKVSLVVRYVPAVGSSVASTQALVYLPGKAGQSEMLAKAEWDTRSSYEGSVQEIAILTNREPSVRESVIEANDRSNTLQTATISVPLSIAQNLRNLPPQTQPSQPVILPVGFVQPAEQPQEPQPLAKPDPMGRGPHALEGRKAAERTEPQMFVDQGMVKLR